MGGQRQRQRQRQRREQLQGQAMRPLQVHHSVCHNLTDITHSLACASLSPSSLTHLYITQSAQLPPLLTHSSVHLASTQQHIVQVKRRAFDSLNYHHHRRRHQKALHRCLLVKIHNSKTSPYSVRCREYCLDCPTAARMRNRRPSTYVCPLNNTTIRSAADPPDRQKQISPLPS